MPREHWHWGICNDCEMGLPEGELTWLYILQLASGDTRPLEGGTGRTDLGVASSDLGVCRSDFQWVLPGAGRPVCSRHIREFGAACGMTGWGRGAVMAPWGTISTAPPHMMASGRDVTAQLEGHLEAVVRLVGPILKATNWEWVFWVRIPAQSSREHTRMAEDCQGQMHISRGVLSRTVVFNLGYTKTS
jgi:hypothetical protein